MKKLILIFIILCMSSASYSAQQAIVQGDTRSEAWTKETANNAEKAFITGTAKITTTDDVQAGKFTVTEQAEPSTPASGYGDIYAKTDGSLYFKNDAGTEILLSGVSVVWGNITGTLSSQTDLQNELNDKQDTTTNLDTLSGPTNWRIVYSNGSGVQIELPLGADGEYVMSNGPAVAPSFETPAGSGDVVGPAGGVVDNEIPLYDSTTGKLIKGSGATIDSEGLKLQAVPVPTDSFLDSNSLNPDQTICQIFSNATTPTLNAVVSDMTFTYQNGGDASGVFTPFMIMDGSANQLEIQVNTTLQAGDILNSELNADAKYDAIEFVIDGGGSAITTGTKGYIEIPWDCTIDSVTMLADQSGSAVVDIWVDTYANYPPLDADSITASAVPTISTAIKSQDATLTGWTTSLTKGSIVGYNVDSAATVEFLTISLKVDK